MDINNPKDISDILKRIYLKTSQRVIYLVLKKY